MPRWLHRVNRHELQSTPAADLPEPAVNYIEDADLSAVVGFRNWYWIITGDVITLEDQAGRDAIDVARTAAQLQREKDEAKAVADRSRQDRRFLALMELMVDEVNLLRAAVVPPLTPARTLQDYKDGVSTRIDGQS